MNYFLEKVITTTDPKLKWRVTESDEDMSSNIYLFRTKKEAQEFIKEMKK